MTTKKIIVDGAMRLIGATPHTIGDGTKNDLVINDLYDETVLDLLRQHPWNFAVKRLQLTQNATAPIFEFEFTYDQPSDFVRFVGLYSNSDATAVPVYKEEVVGTATVFISESNELWLRYVADITGEASPEARMPPDFRRAFMFALARDSALAIATSNTVQEKMEKMAMRTLSRARSTDGLGQTPERRPRGSWVDVRGRSLPVVGD